MRRRRPTNGSNRDDQIVTRSLTKVYPNDLCAVDALDLNVRRGEIFGLLGPNGAGKTTVIGMLTTRVRPTSGAAFVGGVDVWAQPARAKQNIGVVPQSNTLDRSITAFENLYFHARYFGYSRDRARAEAEALLDRFRLGDRGAAMIGTLSGGMAQRLMVARALLHRPTVLFLDEPTTGLDPQSRIALWDLLREIHDEGQTILVTTHYMEEADQLCDRVAVMDGGRILALDGPEQLKRSVQAESVVDLVTSDDGEGLARHLDGLDEVAHADASNGSVRAFVTRGPGVVPRLVVAARDAGYTVTDLSVSSPTLETVFISLTGKGLRE